MQTLDSSRGLRVPQAWYDLEAMRDNLAARRRVLEEQGELRSTTDQHFSAIRKASLRRRLELHHGQLQLAQARNDHILNELRQIRAMAQSGTYVNTPGARNLESARMRFQRAVQDLVPVWQERMLQACTRTLESMERETSEMNRRRQLAAEAFERERAAQTILERQRQELTMTAILARKEEQDRQLWRDSFLTVVSEADRTLRQEARAAVKEVQLPVSSAAPTPAPQREQEVVQAHPETPLEPSLPHVVEIEHRNELRPAIEAMQDVEAPVGNVGKDAPASKGQLPELVDPRLHSLWLSEKIAESATQVAMARKTAPGDAATLNALFKSSAAREAVVYYTDQDTPAQQDLRPAATSAYVEAHEERSPVSPQEPQDVPTMPPSGRASDFQLSPSTTDAPPPLRPLKPSVRPRASSSGPQPLLRSETEEPHTGAPEIREAEPQLLGKPLTEKWLLHLPQKDEAVEPGLSPERRVEDPMFMTPAHDAPSKPIKPERAERLVPSSPPPDEVAPTGPQSAAADEEESNGADIRDLGGGERGVLLERLFTEIESEAGGAHGYGNAGWDGEVSSALRRYEQELCRAVPMSTTMPLPAAPIHMTCSAALHIIRYSARELLPLELLNGLVDEDKVLKYHRRSSRALNMFNAIVKHIRRLADTSLGDRPALTPQQVSDIFADHLLADMNKREKAEAARLRRKVVGLVEDICSKARTAESANTNKLPSPSHAEQGAAGLASEDTVLLGGRRRQGSRKKGTLSYTGSQIPQDLGLVSEDIADLDILADT